VAAAPVRVGRGRTRVAGTREREEEGVALRVDLGPAPRAERLAHESPVLAGHAPVALVAELLEEAGRALDVGEGERDGPAGQGAHPRLRYPDEPAGAGDEPIPPPARGQPGRLAAVG